MTSTMLLSLLAFAAVAWMGFLVYARATGMIASSISERTQVIPETADEVIEFTGRPNYSGIRRSILRADEAARNV